MNALSGSEQGQEASLRVQIVLAEYQALRAELMYFIQAQRESISLLISAAFGQLAGVFFNDRLPDLNQPLFYVYLFVVPFLIFIIMLRALDATAKILVAADYIYRCIKPQLSPVFTSPAEYFYWEDHKASTSRVGRFWLRLLDASKWWVFVFGIALSYVVAIVIYNSGHISASHALSDWANHVLAPWNIPWRFLLIPDAFLFGAAISITLIAIAARVADAFEETSGEAFRELREDPNVRSPPDSSA